MLDPLGICWHAGCPSRYLSPTTASALKQGSKLTAAASSLDLYGFDTLVNDHFDQKRGLGKESNASGQSEAVQERGRAKYVSRVVCCRLLL